MAIDKTQSIIGPVIVTVDGTDIGLTTDDGVTISQEMEIVQLRAPQAIGNLRSHRAHVDMTATFTVQQLSLQNLYMLLDLKEAPAAGVLALKFKEHLTSRSVVFTGPGPNRGTRTHTFVASVAEVGEINYQNTEFATMQVTLNIEYDPVSDSYGTIVDSAGSTTVPTVSSFQWIATNGTATTFTDGATSVGFDATALQFTFNVAIRPDQLTAHRFGLIDLDNNEPVPFTLAYGATGGSPDYTKVVLTPTGGLSESTDYRLFAMPGILSNDGVAMTTLASVGFTTTADV